MQLIDEVRPHDNIGYAYFPVTGSGLKGGVRQGIREDYEVDEV
ncbi:MAG TPA: hypothetical protein V6D17_00865 [Candidatus Obscuribacterales bacterium]